MTGNNPRSFHSHRAIRSMTSRLVGRLEEDLGPRLRDAARALRSAWSDPLGGHGLVSDVILEGGFGYAVSDQTLSANELLDPGLMAALSQADEEYRVDPTTRRPYQHQEAAWHALNQGLSPLVSAGTGSGKTECFLYPVLSSLFAQQRKGHLAPGVQALFLYPTNALINSQRDRLGAWLGTPANNKATPIRFCLYNSALPEKPDGVSRSIAEVGSRRELRESPPPILITNYSMLEIALIRPMDQPIFRGSRGRLRYVVLDEAHTYQGVMAAEIALLIRRTLDAFEVDPGSIRFIATSATFPGASDVALADFAAGLFGVQPGVISVVQGRRSVPDIAKPETSSPIGDPSRVADLVGDEGTFVAHGDRLALDETPETTAAFTSRLTTAGFVVAPETSRLPAAQMLWQTLRRVPELMALRTLLGERTAISLREAAHQLFERSDVASLRAAAELLDLASLARLSIGEQALIPTRWHVAYRRIERLSACLNRRCLMRERLELPPEWTLGGLHPIPIPRCGCQAIVLPLSICQNCGEPLLAGDERVADSGLPRLHAPAPEQSGSLFCFRAQPLEGDLGLNPDTGDLYDTWEEGLIPVRRCGEHCPTCNAEGGGSDAFSRYVGHTRQTAVSVLLEGLFEELPVDIRDPETRPNGGRRLIMFSDSRQIAAQLAPLVERSLRERAVRQVILRQLGGSDSPGDQALRALLPQLQGEAREALARKLSAGRSMSLRELAQQIVQDPESRRQLLAAGERLREVDGRLLDTDALGVDEVAPLLLSELYRRPSLPRSLESMGLIEIRYASFDSLVVPTAHAPWLSNEGWQAMAATLLDSARARGGTLLHGDAAEIVPQFTHGKLVGNGDGTFAVPWLGQSAGRWLAKVLETRKVPCSEGAVKTVADDLWKSVRTTGVLIPERDGFLVSPEAFSLRALEKAYCDPRTGAVFPRSLDRISPATGEQELVEFQWPPTLTSAKDLSVPSGALDLAVRRLIERRAPSIRAVEHTAQIGVDRLREYERLFRDGRRNLLSSTTTMEMGVDIGQLPAVLLTNAPPSPANYLQRAGRAGRRNEGSTLIVTLTSSSPHDAMLFERPSWAFEERGLTPTVRLDREVVVQRHMNAAFLRFAGLTHADVRNPLGTLGSCGDFFLERDEGLLAPVDRLISWLERNGTSGEAEFWKITEPKIRQLGASTALHGYDPQQLGGAAAKLLCLLRDEWRQVDTIITETIDAEAAAGELKGAARLKDIRTERRSSFLLAYLAERQFLPRYGFPIDVISLDSGPTRGRGSEHRLERGLEIGLREYGPGSEVIVGAAKLPSRGLLMGPRQQFTGSSRGANELRQLTLRQCRRCRFLALDLSSSIETCPSCGETALDEARNGVRPSGFSCELKFGDVVGRTRAVEAQKRLPYLPPIFSPSRDSEWRAIVPGLEARYTRDGRVVHRSDGMEHRGFDLCSVCGRTQSREGSSRAFPKKDGGHSMLRLSGKPCPGRYSDGTLLERVSLVHPVFTDTLEIRLSGALDPGGSMDETFATTFAFAVRDAAASYLGTSPREIGAQSYRTIDEKAGSKWAVVLFDQVAGGAGFMEDVRSHLPRLIMQAVQRLRGDAQHDLLCKAACPKCLLSYQTQFHVDKLDRQSVIAHFNDQRCRLLEMPADLLERFGSTARPLVDGIDTVIGWLREAESAIAYLGSSIELANSAAFRAMLALSERGNSAEILVDDMLSPSSDGEFVDRPSALLFERFLSTGGKIRVITEPPPTNAPVAAIRRNGVDHVLGALDDTPARFTGSLVDGLAPERADVLRHLPGRQVTAAELHPKVVRVVEVVKEQVVERLVPAPNATVRVSVPSAIGGTWRELLDHIAVHAERQLKIRPPFHGRDNEPTSVAYSDRYLRSERALRSLHQLLVAIGARPNVVAAHVATLSPEQAGKGLADDYRSAKELASAWNQIAPGRKSISFRDVPHSRTLNVHYADGTQWIVDLDEGVTVFQERSRGSINRAFLVHVTMVRRV